MTIELSGLQGQNPLAFLAALGVLAAVDRQAPELGARLWWSDELVSRAHIDGPATLADVVDLANQDRLAWRGSLVLDHGPDGDPVDDVKPDLPGVRRWAERLRSGWTAEDRRDLDLFVALLAEDAAAGKGDAKPSMLHFTAGQQRFLHMARELRDKVDASMIHSALAGPWRYESTLPALGWDGRGERIYALRGADPQSEKKTSIPGAEWLALVGLSFFPSAKYDGPAEDQLLTAGCRGSWKRGTFHWPLWSCPVSPAVIRSVLTWDELRDEAPAKRQRRGVFRMYEAPIRRSDQGGYGSFGPAAQPGA